MKKRLIAIIFSLVCSASMMPVGAMAAQNTADVSDNTGGKTTYDISYEDIETTETAGIGGDVKLADGKYEVGDWEYTVTNGTAVISKYKGTDASVTVPTRVTIEGLGYNIKTIGERAFEGVQTMTSVIIPEEINRIDAAAFKDCTSLSSITINGNIADCTGESLNTWDNYDIKYGVFVNAGKNAASMTVTFGPNATRIPAYIFATAREEGENVYPHVTNLVIGDKVTEIGNYAFNRCYDMK